MLLVAAGRAALVAAALGALLLLTAAVAGTAALPGVQAAGGRFIAVALGAAVGTAAAPLMPWVAAVAGLAAARSLAAGGGAAACATLGLSAAGTWRRLWPLWAALAVSTGVVGFWGEPAAWTALHDVRGARAATATAWASLQAGEVRTLGEGGGLVVRSGGVLDGLTGDRTWALQARGIAPSADRAGWELQGVRIAERGPQGGVGAAWEVGQLTLRPEGAGAPALPRSPWAQSPGGLMSRQGTSRGRLVLHRRLALVLCVPLLAWVGWRAGWDERGPRARGSRSVALAALAVAVLVVTRLADRACGWGGLDGVVAGHVPLALSAAAAWFFGRRWR